MINRVSLHFILGIIFALLAGVSSYLGLVLQKKVINELPEHSKRNERTKRLLKHPVWLAGLTLYIVFPSIFFMLAESLIGPVLVPGITQAGLIVLVIAANKIVGEQIKIKEIAGIIFLVMGIIFITASRLIIHYQDVDLNNQLFTGRVIRFTVLMIILWLLFDISCFISNKHKAVLKGLASGFPYTITNLWIIMLYASMFPVFKGNRSMILIIFFIVSSVILVVVNILGIMEIQRAFRFGAVSLVAPMQQIPIQIAPVIYYFYVFNVSGIGNRSLFFILSGILLILFSGFMFSGKREFI